MKYGLIGEKLGHSFSKEIHEMIGYYKYEIHEVQKDEIDDFMKKKDFIGINVTIPYKETVIPYLDYIDDNALKIGAVNTVVNINGLLYGYNTDYYGFMESLTPLLTNRNITQALVLGASGGAARAVLYALNKLNINTIKVSRSTTDGMMTYELTV